MVYDSHIEDMQIKAAGYYTGARGEMIQYIPREARRILDVGCGEGLFSRQLKRAGATEVWGIELEAAAAEQAALHLDRVLSGDIAQLLHQLPDSYFDCIVFNDVLEHLADPFYVLRAVKAKLQPDGVIVSCIPNVRYILNLRDLLARKQWKYTDGGILDKTHLRFFTKKSLIETFHTLGYDILKMEGLRPIKTWKFTLLNLICCGNLSDTRFIQFASVIRPRRTVP
jgi:2-polyprenyl-3-methyl-5-hydroxy-6-metoxy-1,4-benzoquinol methylase